MATDSMAAMELPLAREAGEEVPENLSKADASVLIDRLQTRSDRLHQD